VGLALVAALASPEVRSGLRSDAVRQRLSKFGPAVQKEAVKLYASLDADFAQQRTTLEKMLADLPAGDIRRGQVIFNSPKAACASCHKIGYGGGTVGPDLTKIGGIRAKRDLLESIVFPSASFVRSYEPVVVTTRNGKSFSGVLRKDAPDEVVVAVSADQEMRVARDDIAEMRPGEVSLMPAGLEKQLSLQEFADLVAFLMACK
jgi:putative heme-binding domain-containing protein